MVTEERRARTLSSRRLLVSLIGGFAIVALGLAALGLYGIISYTVAKRTKEIGIRMALGATAARMQREVVRRTLMLALCGLIVGLAGAVASARFIQSLLYDVSSIDPGTFVAMTALVLVCALGAGFLPARCASSVESMQALRTD